MSQEHKDLVVAATEQIWNQNDVSAIERFISPEFVGHDPAVAGPILGLNGYTHYYKTFATAFPDQHFTNDEVLAEGDAVIVRWFVVGTHTGPLGEIPPTGNKARIPGINIVRVAHGRIVEEHMSWDTLGLMNQLGLVPSTVMFLPSARPRRTPLTA